MTADTHADDFAQDAALFARMRAMWAAVDPVPADLIDRMVAAIAVEDLGREYALLTLIETEKAAVRGDVETLTLQFSDGTVTVLLHLTRTDHGSHRVDGWVDAPTADVTLVQDAGEHSTTPDANGRFAFDGIGSGMSVVRLTVRAGDDGSEQRQFQTPHFEV